MSTPLKLSSTLEEANAWLLARLNEGVDCPCCGQLAKLYKRSLNNNMARVLVLLYKAQGHWVHLSSQLSGLSEADIKAVNNREWAKMVYWGLVQERAREGDAKKNSGFWTITETGVSFVLGLITVQRYALVYDGRLYGFEGEEVSIDDVIGEAFDYAELMSR